MEEWIYIRLDDKMCITFRGSSMVEQQAVNLKVRGPSPRRGARHKSAPGFAKSQGRIGAEAGAELYPPRCKPISPPRWQSRWQSPKSESTGLPSSSVACGNDLCEPGLGETKESCLKDCSGED